MTATRVIQPPPDRPSQWILYGLSIVGGLAALGVAGYALLGEPATPQRVRPLPIQISQPGTVFPEDLFVWWSEHIGTAAGMYLCRPANGADAVVVWTDQADAVIAFGAALEEAQLPAYAAGLARSGTADAHQPAHVAAAGHVVLTTGKMSALQLKDVKLECVRTWDD